MRVSRSTTERCRGCRRSTCGGVGGSAGKGEGNDLCSAGTEECCGKEEESGAEEGTAAGGGNYPCSRRSSVRTGAAFS